MGGGSIESADYITTGGNAAKYFIKPGGIGKCNSESEEGLELISMLLLSSDQNADSGFG